MTPVSAPMIESVPTAIQQLRTAAIGSAEWMDAYEYLLELRRKWFRYEAIYVGGYLLLAVGTGTALTIPDVLFITGLLTLVGTLLFFVGWHYASKAVRAVFWLETRTSEQELLNAAGYVDGLRWEYRRRKRDLRQKQ